MMDVYKIVPTTKYSSGYAIVAAPSANDAEILFRNHDYRNFEFEEGKCKVEPVYDLQCTTKEPKLILDGIRLD